MKRTIIEMASPCLVLLSNTTDTSLVTCPCPGKESSFFIFSISCLKTRLTYCRRCVLLVGQHQREECQLWREEFLLSKIIPLLLVCKLVQLMGVCCLGELPPDSVKACSIIFDFFSFSFPVACFLKHNGSLKYFFFPWHNFFACMAKDSRPSDSHMFIWKLPKAIQYVFRITWSSSSVLVFGWYLSEGNGLWQ